MEGGGANDACAQSVHAGGAEVEHLARALLVPRLQGAPCPHDAPATGAVWWVPGGGRVVVGVVGLEGFGPGADACDARPTHPSTARQAAGKPCYDDAFADERYWLVRDPTERAGCEQFVHLDMERSLSPPASGLETQFIGLFFGGVTGVITDLSQSGLEIFGFGVAAAVVANLLLMIILRCFVKVTAT